MRHRPPINVPLGMEWLTVDMPHGNGRVPPPDAAAQPVKEYEVRTCQKNGHTYEVVEWLYAEVRRQNLGKGTPTNDSVRTWVREVGRPKDDAGHIIGLNQGGIGTKHWNIFPQNSNFNRGVFASDVERIIHNACSLDGTVKIWFRFIFGNPSEPCRPTKFRFFILLSDGTHFNHDLDNP